MWRPKARKRLSRLRRWAAVFEWYDFYLYGLLATIISAQFFSGVNETTGFIFALGAFAAGFAVRPFGATVFGRIGDLVGPKNTSLVKPIIMSGCILAALTYFPLFGASSRAANPALHAARASAPVSVIADPDTAPCSSLPYHVGNGWFGGFLPTTAFAMVAATGDTYYGL